MSDPAAAPSAAELAADADASASGSLETVAALVQQLHEVEEELAIATAHVAALTARQTQLLENTIPDAMDAARCGLFRTTNGGSIEVTDVIRANIPKEKLHAAIAWLRAHKYEALIKNEIVVSTGKGEDETAAKVQAALKALGITPTTKEYVHAQTLSAWCREQLAKDKPPALPADLLGLFHKRVAKIKTPKE